MRSCAPTGPITRMGGVAAGHMRRQPAGEPEVRDPGRVIGVIVREEQHIDAAHRHAELIEPDGGAAAGIDQQLLIAGFDEGARPETVGTGNGRSRPEQGHAEIIGTLIDAS